jgi:hypothetical protein
VRQMSYLKRVEQLREPVEAPWLKNK